ncbi:succinylarginine dihydrolase [Klebsiella pneumoniae]|uniref:Succinylarginine dihydrolase n=1 Tax=Klebsiella pneumoniae TaxID=573 RepID=A0A377ZUF8_KLEPN|nr:succinylarginine dihydrolase [Klebsiella pneumoniae]
MKPRKNNRDGLSNPKKAALQGLYKMKALADRGFVQGILPPQPRPNLRLLREVGFQGSDEQVIRQAAHAAPQLLSASAPPRRCGPPTRRPSHPRRTAPMAKSISPSPT